MNNNKPVSTENTQLKLELFNSQTLKEMHYH